MTKLKFKKCATYAIFLKFSRKVLFDKIFRPFDIRLDFQLNQYILHRQAPQLMPFINQKSLPATVLIINSLLTKRSTNSTKLRKSLSLTHTHTQRMSGEEKVVCVTGASGYIASWLVKLLLQRGYTVKATVRDTSQCTILFLSLQFVLHIYV